MRRCPWSAGSVARWRLPANPIAGSARRNWPGSPAPYCMAASWRSRGRGRSSRSIRPRRPIGPRTASRYSSSTAWATRTILAPSSAPPPSSGSNASCSAERPEQALPSDASYRIAEGGFEYLDLYRAPLPSALAALRPAYRIIGAALDPRAGPLRTGARPAALVLGNEETGLDPATLAACDEIVAIPGSGNVQSLNVSAAAAILIYELSCR